MDKYFTTGLDKMGEVWKIRIGIGGSYIPSRGEGRVTSKASQIIKQLDVDVSPPPFVWNPYFTIDP